MAPPAHAAGTGMLPAGQGLATGQTLYSPNGLFWLSMQPDGNLVEYMMENGAPYATWASGTSGQGPSNLVMQSDGNLVVYRNTGGATWSSGVIPAIPTASANRHPSIGPGQVLLAGQSLNDNGFTFTVQTDGNLTSYTPQGSLLWQSNTSGNSGAYLVMQHGGNLVEFTLGGKVVWQSGTSGSNECLLGDQSTGVPVVRMKAWWTWNIFSVTPCYMGGQAKPTVGVVGDSITLMTTPSIETDMGTSYAYTISGQFGWTIGLQLAAIQSDLANPEGAPNNFIVNLGTNDALVNSSTWQASYNKMVSLLSSRSCVILVTVNTVAGTIASSPNTVPAQINAAESATAAAHPNFHILHWNSVVHQSNNITNWMHQGGVHPNPSGQQVLAYLYMLELHAACGI